MSWKEILSVVFLLVVVVLLGLYWFFPLDEIEFNISGTRNTNFTLNSSVEKGMQFYENMRYKSSDISYRIDDCNLKKTDDMETALNLIEQLSVLNFYSVESNEEIIITCDEKAKFKGDLFVAGEGGPINITRSENFNVIHKGAITLIRDSSCNEPKVAIHELLHALGFDHSENENNIMYPVSKCSQEIGQDTIDTIDWLYSFQSLPDLVFEDASASMKGRYLDLSMTIRNEGLQNSGVADIIIYADGDTLKEISLEEIPVGAGRIITLTNILVLKTSIDKLEIVISSDFSELNKENNEIVLQVE